MNITQRVINEIKKCETREEAAAHYRNAMQFNGIDWVEVNHFIADKWSLSGLKYIKAKAWG